ncbi:hypothetical protein GFY24_38900 [Nocardia sp. SYP-A9097]|uniref:hypothetical protein n=1 Tax=Nocardia sp. SYP-A9097 TaxID=2663237 RepID=UPI00129B6ED2|nr:hypothetical protein [Nocardia sp. SYP-A9097]MRH93319.1 hypothetical protein [Nocardia sp. SYP-A9097]
MGDYDAINEHNAARAHAEDWPELTGSPDQVRWAITVRQNKIDEFDAGQTPEPERGRMRAVLLRETRAAVWLDNRAHPWGVVWLANLTEAERAALLP